MAQQQVVSSTSSDPSSAPNIVAADNNNPLRQFRSYAYHFQIIACESTDVSNYLTGTPNVQNPTTPITPPPDSAFERPDPQNPRATITSAAGNYIIVIDTRTDVDFIIEDVQWGTTFIGSPNTSNSAVALSTVMTDGTINLLEPRGVNFLNLLAQVGDELDVDMICMPWLLRVQFYGQTDTGITTYLPPTESARPFPFVPVDITGSVDERGTTYKMDIVGVTNGICYNPNFNALCDNVTFHTHPGENLATHLARFQQQIQTMYNYQRSQITSQLNGIIDLSAAATIAYEFVLEPGSDVLQTLNDFGTNVPPQSTDKYGRFPIKGTKEGGIAEVITKLLGSSQQWVAKAAQGNPPDAASLENTDKRYTFKVTQKFQSTSPSVTSKGNVTVYVIVSEYKYDTQVVQTTYGGQTEIKPTDINPDQVVTYNYIYTGQNTDIIDMNMDLSLGLSLLQTLSTAKSLTNQATDTQGGPIRFQDPITGTSLIGPTNIHGRVRKGTPIFAPFQWINSFFKEAEAMQNTATADAVWKSFANYQSVNTKLTIHGNPLILGKLVDPNRTTPNYLQVNIKMPSTPDDIWEYQLTGNQSPSGYYQPFWYTGYYLLVSATNKFSGGLFTQELDLVSMPQVSIEQGSVAAAEQAQDNPMSGRQFFFNTQPTTAPITSTPPTAPVTPVPSTNNVTPVTSPTSTNPLPSSHQNFVAYYWNYALQSSQSTGLDPDFALAHAAVETGWGTNSYSQNYSAMVNYRAYYSPNGFWTGAVIPNTGNYTSTTRGNPPGFRAYDSPTNSFLDQYNLLSRVYPSSASAPSGPSGIDQFANGLMNGKGGAQWTATDQSTYVTNVINAYSSIQGYKTNLGIQSNQLYAGGPEPTTATTPTTNVLALNTTTTPSVGTNTSTVSVSSTYATGRTIEQASIAQKTPIFV